MNIWTKISLWKIFDMDIPIGNNTYIPIGRKNPFPSIVIRKRVLHYNV